MFHRCGKCQQFLLATTFACGVPQEFKGVCCAHGIRIIRALRTVLNRVCHITACATDRTCISPTNQKYFLYIINTGCLMLKKKRKEIPNIIFRNYSL